MLKRIYLEDVAPIVLIALCLVFGYIFRVEVIDAFQCCIGAILEGIIQLIFNF